MSADRHRVVVAGGGVGGLETVLALHDLAPDHVAVTLLSPETEFTYEPLSTGEAFGVSQATRYPVEPLAAEHGAQFVRDSLASVEPEAQRLTTGDGQTLEYDTLVVALGASHDAVFADALTFSARRNVPGFRELLEDLRAGHVHSVAFVVPGGIVWPFPLYELALMTGEFVAEHGLDVRLTLVTPGSTPLALFGGDAGQAMERLLEERNVQVRAGLQAQEAGPGRALLEPDGEILSADRIVTIPRLHGPRIPGLPHDRDGFIPVDAHGRVRDTQGVFAVGDCANYPIKQGGLAAQQADVVAETIAAQLGAAEMPGDFVPVLRGMLLTGHDRRYLRRPDLDLREGTVAGHALWWPPTKIAGRYLAPALGALDEHKQLEAAPGGERVPVEVPVAPQLRDLSGDGS